MCQKIMKMFVCKIINHVLFFFFSVKFETKQSINDHFWLGFNFNLKKICKNLKIN